MPQPRKPVIVVLGDSLSAGYGIASDAGWVALLRHRLAQDGLDYSVANGSISGDTSSGGRARLPGLLDGLHPALLIVELGGNDALRGIPLSTTQDNLAAIVEEARLRGVKVLLIGMRIPPNYGAGYARRFAAMYRRLADRYRIPLVPFLLAGIADKPALFQDDQIHPNARAQPALLENVYPVLRPML